MAIGSRMARDVRKLLDDMGYNVTLRRTGRSAYDTDAGSASSSGNTDVTVRVAMLEYKETEVDGQQIQRGDRKVIMAATDADGDAISLQPQTDDQFVGEGDTVSVIMARPLKVGATVIGYICQVRE